MVQNKTVFYSNYQKNVVASVVKIKIQNVCETPYFLPRHSDLTLKFLPFLWLVLRVLHYGAVCIEMLEINWETYCLFHEMNVNLVLRSRFLSKTNTFFAVRSNKIR